MNVTFIQHMASNGPAMIGEILRARGAQINVVQAAYEDLSEFDPLSPDLLVVLGGSPGVYQQADYPFLTQEINIIEKRVAAGLPYLGICLGAQLLAAALGAKVYVGTNGTELGWYDIELTRLGKESAIAPFETGLTKVMQWHGDTFDLPKRADLLASSKQYPHQIFSYQDCVLGFQPHIEVTDKVVADWLVEGAGFFNQKRELLQKIKDDTKIQYPLMKKATRTFLNGWLDDIAVKQKEKHA
ncbi:MAG: glutamine amidotransferase-related protein [Micavibrio sp.]